jgi:chromosome segregation ATPase
VNELRQKVDALAKSKAGSAIHISSLEESLESLKSENQSLQEENQTLKKGLDKVTQEKDGLSANLEQTRKEYETSLAKLTESLKQAEAGKTKANSDLQNSLSVFQSEKDALNQSITELKKSLASAESEKKRVEHEKEELRVSLEKITAAKHQEIALASASETSLQQQVSSLNDENQLLKLQIDSLSSELRDLKASSQQRVAEFQELQKKHSEELAKLNSKHRAELEVLQSDIQELEEKLAESDQRGQLQSRELVRLRTDNEKLSDSIQSAEDEHASQVLKLNQTIAGLKENKALDTVKKEELQTLSAEVTELKAALSSQRAHEESLMRETTTKIAELREARAKISELNSQLASNQQTSRIDESALRNDVRQKQSRIEALELQLSQMVPQTVVRDLELKLAKKSAKVQTQKSLGKVSSGDAGRMKKQVKEMRAEIAGIRKSIRVFEDLERYGQLVELAKKRVKSVVGELEAQKQQNEVQEIELKQLRKQSLQKRQEFRDQKSVADKALKVANSMRQELEDLRVEVRVKTERLAAVEEELQLLNQEDLNLQKKHQSALRLIGELWTKNQTLVRGHRGRQNTSK